MKKQILILKQSDTKILVHPEYLEIKTLEESYIMAFIHIKMIYLNKSIQIDIGTCYRLSEKVTLFITDHNGYIIAKLENLKGKDA